MDSEDWKEFKKKGKEIRLNRQDKHRRICYTFAYRNNLRHTAIQPWHIRLASEDVVLDIFPQGKKYNNLTEGRRGTYRNLEGF